MHARLQLQRAASSEAWDVPEYVTGEMVMNMMCMRVDQEAGPSRCIEIRMCFGGLPAGLIMIMGKEAEDIASVLLELKGIMVGR